MSSPLSTGEGGATEGRARRPVEPIAPAPEPLPPVQPRSCFGSLVALLAVLVGGVYVLNLTMGIDLAPDNLPLVGNLDEAAATTMLLLGLRYLLGKGRRD